jgi:putative acetyltransferase
MIIRTESSSDAAEIRAVHEAAFGRAAEAELVDQLRSDGDAVISLAAVWDGVVVGHVMFSTMSAPFRALGLAPVATAPAHHRRGIAAALIRDGLARARREGWEAVFVLGDPAYYSRFGFDVGAAAGFDSPYAGPHFMALSLAGGALPATVGPVAYAPAFTGLD